MARRLAVLAALLVVLARPGIAWADTDILGGFTSGVSDFVSPPNEQVIVTPEQDFNDSYEPMLIEENERANSVVEVGPYDSIVNWINSLRLTFAGVTRGPDRWYEYPVWFLISNGFGIPVMVTIVFMWWGVRKAIRMIITAWRKGHASI